MVTWSHIVSLTSNIYPWWAQGAGNNQSPLQRHIDLLFCQVYFSSQPPPLLSWSQLPIAPSVSGEQGILREQARERGANIFCRDSFNPVLRMLLVAAPWVSLGHCSWKREAAGASCSSQPGFGWIIKKFTRQVETKVLAHSWLLSPFPHWLDHTSYITSWSGLRCQWRQECVRMLFSKMEKRFRQLASFIAATAVILVNLKQFELSKQHRNIAFDEFQRNDLSTKVENKWEKS